MDFITRLRQNNVIPSGIPNLNLATSGSSSPDFFTMAQTAFNLATQAKEQDRAFEREMFNKKAALENIARSAAKPVEQKPMNVIYNPGFTDFQRASLGFKERELEQKGEIASRGLDIKDQAAGAKSEIDKGKLKIAQQRADVYDFKSKHPNLVPLKSKGGTIHYMNPQTGETFDTGIDNGTLTDQELENLKSGNRTKEINARGEIQKDLQETRGEQRLGEISAQTAGRIESNAAKPNQAVQPNQQRIALANKATQLRNTRPDLAKFISFDDKGNVQIATPTYWNGMTQQHADEINQFLYGTSGQKKTSFTNKDVVNPKFIVNGQDNTQLLKGLFSKYGSMFGGKTLDQLDDSEINALYENDMRDRPDVKNSPSSKIKNDPLGLFK